MCSIPDQAGVPGKWNSVWNKFKNIINIFSDIVSSFRRGGQKFPLNEKNIKLFFVHTFETVSKGVSIVLDPLIVEETERLLAEGLSARKIAKLMKISRGSIASIRHGTRNLYQKKESDEVPEPSGDYVRCPKCGAKTQLPCLGCEIRKIVRKNGRILWPENSGVEIEIELVGEHLERYIQIRDWRAKSENPYYTDIPENWPWRRKKETGE